MRDYEVQTVATTTRKYRVIADTRTAAQDRLDAYLDTGEDPQGLVEFIDVDENEEEVLR